MAIYLNLIRVALEQPIGNAWLDLGYYEVVVNNVKKPYTVLDMSLVLYFIFLGEGRGGKGGGGGWGRGGRA